MTQPILPAPTTPPGDPAPPPEPATPPTPDDKQTPKPGEEPLGAAGLRALQAERARVAALEQRLAGLAPLQQLAEALGAKADEKTGKSEVDALRERFDELNSTLEAERTGRWRAEIAQETGLPPALAARLQGATREELLADAQALAALVPPAVAGPRNPVPDPSQGSRGGTNGDLESLIKAAQDAGDVRKVIALQQQKLVNNHR